MGLPWCGGKMDLDVSLLTERVPLHYMSNNN